MDNMPWAKTSSIPADLATSVAPGGWPLDSKPPDGLVTTWPP
jgi:hypothetical protein